MFDLRHPAEVVRAAMKADQCHIRGISSPIATAAASARCSALAIRAPATNLFEFAGFFRFGHEAEVG
jgi:hypothetical protein